MKRRWYVDAGDFLSPRTYGRLKRLRHDRMLLKLERANRLVPERGDKVSVNERVWRACRRDIAESTLHIARTPSPHEIRSSATAIAWRLLDLVDPQGRLSPTGHLGSPGDQLRHPPDEYEDISDVEFYETIGTLPETIDAVGPPTPLREHPYHEPLETVVHVDGSSRHGEFSVTLSRNRSNTRASVELLGPRALAEEALRKLTNAS
jgi:hypothetical protein